MPRLLHVFFIGMLVSFLGTLPLGTLNVAAMQLSVTDGIIPALWFSLGALLAEILYVRLSLVAMGWVRKQVKLFKALEWITLLIIIALAIFSFAAAGNASGNSKNIILSNTMHRFFLGLMMSAINPVQIPFWFGWSSVLFTKKVLQPKPSFYNFYIVGIGIGTFIGNCIFIFGGQIVADRLNSNQHILHYIIGSIFGITAIMQVWRMLKKKDVVHNINHPEDMAHPFEKQIH
ncbi:MAG TPA: LysE family transporter [Chitinophagaceae bacterium]|nr:LysE family transporter [Chitinophagaceae bacterium]